MIRDAREVFAEIERCLELDAASAAYVSGLKLLLEAKAQAGTVAAFARACPHLHNFLSGLSPKYVLALFLSPKYGDIRPTRVSEFATVFASRRLALLDCIYGEGFSVAALPFLRFPSRCKRELVNVMVQAVSKNLPWVNSRLVHCMAFRPEVFEDRPSRGDHDWGPLYRRVYLDKGSRRKRYLDVPNYALKLVQSAILKTVLNGRLESLPDCVFGFRPGNDRNIFANARAHLGRAVAVSLDIKDFFPSIGIEQVIEALMPRQLVLKVPGEEDGEARVVRIPWSHDAALLVAKLVTYCGRLPQGAPTSPAVSNLVFAPLDKELDEWARWQKLRYTRYADDMTFSASASTFKGMFTESPKRFRDEVAEQAAKILKQGGFLLNQRKTRISRIEEGHHITGLRVTAEEVSLRRETRRRWRVTLHSVESHGLVKAAERLGAREASRPRHDWRGDERGLHSLMQKFLRDIDVIDCRQTAAGLSRFKDATAHRLEGPEKSFFLEKFTKGLIQGEVKPRLDDGCLRILEPDGRTAFELHAKRNLGFLALGHRQVRGAVRLFQAIRGFDSFLNAANAADAAFRPVQEFRTLVRARIEEMDLMPGVMPRIEQAQMPSTRIPLTAGEELDHECKRFLELRRSLIPYLGGSHRPERSASEMEELRSPVKTRDDFKAFSTALWGFVVGSFERCLPKFRESGSHQLIDGVRFFRQLTLVKEFFAGTRHADYEDIADFCQTWCKTRSLTDDFDCAEAQRRLLVGCKVALEDAGRLRQEGEPSEKLARNTFSHDPAEHFRLLRKELGELREALEESPDHPGVYPSESRKGASLALEGLTAPRGDSDTWAQMKRFAAEVYKLVHDRPVISFTRNLWPTEEVQEAAEKLVKLLRNWDAHIWAEGSRDREVQWCHRKCERLLGRSYSGEGELALTPLEALEIQVNILENVIRFLNALRGLGPERLRELADKKKTEQRQQTILRCPSDRCGQGISLEDVECAHCHKKGIEKLDDGDLRCRGDDCLEKQDVPCPKCGLRISRWKL